MARAPRAAGKATAAKTRPAAVPKDTGTSWGTVRKQAVVVIHGIGEQLPLQTLRGFVETVYQRDPLVSGGRNADGQRQIRDPDLGTVNQVWAVPDDATGTPELRRISTPPDDTGTRTDFFEFYWADVMEGTPIDAMVAWVRGLLIRSPWAVPNKTRVRIAWYLLWIVSLIFLAAWIVTLDPTGTLASALVGWAPKFDPRIVGTIFALIGVGVLVYRFSRATTLSRVKIETPLMLVAGGLALVILPASMLADNKVWTAALGLATAWLLGLITPYVGDIARYVRATPATIDKRRQVRERGLKLLDGLHGNDKETGKPLYDRIVIVAHSLGAIIGYDLIQLYWQQEGPTHHKPAMQGNETERLLHQADEFVKQCWLTQAGPPFDLDKFQATQAALGQAIKAEGLKFKITDFITLGSPLTHADFLIADDREELERNFEERLLSSSPPRPDRPRTTMIYRDYNEPEGPGRGPFIHFAAPFASIKWTNIYDEEDFPLLGDIVSGKLGASFGPGIRQHKVEMRRPGWPGLWGRLLTHTLYWTWDKSYEAGKEPPHILFLRDAIGLKPTAPLRTRNQP